MYKRASIEWKNSKGETVKGPPLPPVQRKGLQLTPDEKRWQTVYSRALKQERMELLALEFEMQDNLTKDIREYKTAEGKTFKVESPDLSLAEVHDAYKAGLRPTDPKFMKEVESMEKEATPSYFCLQCGRLHVRGKIYTEHMEYSSDDL